jgi:xylan 1,4-beta-xylosidase
VYPKDMPRAHFIAVLLLAMMAFSPGCQTQHTGLDAQDLSRMGEGEAAPAFDAGALPAPPAGATGAVRAVSNYSYQETDTWASEGATWTGNRLQLGSGAAMTYAILVSIAGGQQVRAISIDGTCNGLWLGVSDYSRGVWSWLPGPLDAGAERAVPAVQLLNQAGEMYIALVCPAGASADVAVTLLIDEPGSVITLGPDLAGEVLKPLLGVNAGPYPSGEAGNADLTGEYQALGVNYVRTHDFYGPLDFCVMYPDRAADPSLESSYDFTESDLRWQKILDCGAEPYFRLGDSYNNPTPPADAAERANMALAAVQIVHHYLDGQWSGFTTPFAYIEIWNEPDGGTFWPGHTQLEFFQFYAAVAQGLKAAFPALKIGGPGFTIAAYKLAAGQEYVKSFLGYMRDNVVPLDFLSWHIYSNSPTEYSDAGAWYRDQLSTYGFNAAESHVTEYNTATSGSEDTDYGLRAGALGATLLTAAWIKLQSPEAAVDVALFYRGNDTSISLPTFFGLYKADGEPKKIARAFALWSALCTYPALVQSAALAAGGGASPLWALAGRKDANQALLVANPGTAATTYSLGFSDGSYPHNYAMTLREMSELDEGVTSNPTDGILITIAPNTVQLIEIAPLP